MKKHNTLLALIIILSSPFSLKSQILDSLYRDDHFNIIGLRDSTCSLVNFIENFDDNEKYIGIVDKGKEFVAKFDEDMRITDSIDIIPYTYKYNNRFNNLICRLKRTSPDSVLVDSIYIGYCDINNNCRTIRVADTAFESGEYQAIFLNEKKYAAASVPSVLYGDSGMNVDHFRISIIDTLGNIERSKIYPQKTNITFSMIEYGSKLFFSKYAQTNTAITYLINKETLEIEDSIEGYYRHMKIVNDSLLICIRGGLDIFIDIININSKLKKSIVFPVDSINNYFTFMNPMMVQSIDYVNEDSIYFCYSIQKEGQTPSGYIEVVNFSSNGNLNFRYQFDAIQQSYGKQMNGIRATKDGGLIMSILAYSSFSNIIYEAWVIKFMPNGFVGLSNVETGEKASLKVYPNPAKDFVLVDIEADKFVEADIEIYDLGGRMVKRSRLSAKVGNRIDVSDLRAGVYSYRVALNGKGVSGKIVIG